MNRQERTFRLDLLRSFPTGILETLGTTFAVLLAIRVFHAPSAGKAMLVGAAPAGLLASLAVVPLVRRWAWTPPKANALLWLLSSLSFLLLALGPESRLWFQSGVFCAIFFLALGAPLMAPVYRRNYGAHDRGRLFAWAAMGRMGAAMIAAWLIGLWLGGGESHYHQLFLVYAACALAGSICLWYMEAAPLRSDSVHLFSAFRHTRDDPAFRKLLIVWMFIGLGNLSGMAVFVEYVTNPVHGIALPTASLGLLTTTLPFGFALISIVGWGWLFDHVHFYRLRGFISILFLFGIAAYYLVPPMAGLIIGMILHGLARGGGNVAWSLWVTKFAREDHVTEYMSVHTFLTGVRGVLTPFAAFFLIELTSPTVVAILSCSLLLLGTLGILPEMIRATDPTREGEAVVPRPPSSG